MEFFCDLLFAPPNAQITGDVSVNSRLRDCRYDSMEDPLKANLLKYRCYISILCYQSICDVAIAVSVPHNYPSSSDIREGDIVIPIFARFNWTLYFTMPTDCYKHLKNLFVESLKINEYLVLNNANINDSTVITLRMFPPEVSTLAIKPFSLESMDCLTLAASLSAANNVAITFTKADGVHTVPNIPILEPSSDIDIIYPYICETNKKKFGLDESSSSQENKIIEDIQADVQNILINALSSKLNDVMQKAGISVNTVMPINLASSICTPRKSLVTQMTQTAEAIGINPEDITVLTPLIGTFMEVPKNISTALLNQIYVNANSISTPSVSALTSADTTVEALDRSGNANNQKKGGLLEAYGIVSAAPNRVLDFVLMDMLPGSSQDGKKTRKFYLGDDLNKLSPTVSSALDGESLYAHMQIDTINSGSTIIDCNIENEVVRSTMDTLARQDVFIFQTPFIGSVNNNKYSFTKTEASVVEKTYQESSNTLLKSLLVPYGTKPINGICKSRVGCGFSQERLIDLVGVYSCPPSIVVSTPPFTFTLNKLDFFSDNLIPTPVLPNLTKPISLSVLMAIFSNADSDARSKTTTDVHEFLKTFATSIHKTVSITGETGFVETPKIRAMCTPTKTINVKKVAMLVVDSVLKLLKMTKKDSITLFETNAGKLFDMAKRLANSIIDSLTQDYWDGACTLFGRTLANSHAKFIRVPQEILCNTPSTSMVLSLPSANAEDLSELSSKGLQATEKEILEELKKKELIEQLHEQISSLTTQVSNLETEKKRNEIIAASLHVSNVCLEQNNTHGSVQNGTSVDSNQIFNGKQSIGMKTTNSSLADLSSSCNNSFTNKLGIRDGHERLTSSNLYQTQNYNQSVLSTSQQVQPSPQQISSVNNQSSMPVSVAAQTNSIYQISDAALVNAIADVMREIDESNKTNMEYTEITTNTFIDTETGRKKVVKRVKKRRTESTH